MTSTQFSRSFASEQPLVTDAVAATVGWLQECEVAEDAAGNVEIVLAEALNNVVEHAYKYREDGTIELDISIQDSVLSVELRDEGDKMGEIPQKKEMRGAEIAVEDLPEGGFGWFLIHSLTRRIRYAFVDGKNTLILEIDAPEK